MGTDRVTIRTAPPARRRFMSAAGRAWGKGLFLVVLCGLWGWSVQAGRGQPGADEIVVDVIPMGNKSVPSDKILRMVNTRPGSPFNPVMLQEDVTRVLSSGLFRDVRAKEELVPDERTGQQRLVVYICVTEFPSIVREVIYKNAHHISQKDLDEMTRIRAGMPLDPTLNKRACFEIQEALKKKGRYFASVTLEEGYQPDHTRVVFNITEGPVVRVRSINFTGQEQLATASRLRTQVVSARPFLFLFKGEFNPGMADEDINKLQEYYNNNGFLRAVVSREMKFSDDFRWVDLTYHVHEGAQFKVSDTQVEGTHLLSKDQVNSIIQLRVGDSYNQGVVNADIRNLTDYAGYRGHEVKVKHELYETEQNKVRVLYEVQESKPFKVGQIIIVGNEVTQDRVIRRVIDLYPGQIIQFPEIRRAEASLARLGLFEIKPEEGIRPTITPIDGPIGSDYKDLLVQVKEAKTGSLMLGGGLNSNNGVFGSIVLNEKNFNLFNWPTSFDSILEGKAWRGAGQEFRVEAVPGNVLQRYTISFREPFLFDRPYSLTTGAYFWNRYFNEYAEDRYGGRITIGHNFTRSIGGSVGIRIEEVNVYNVGAGAPVDYTSVEGGHFQYVPRVGMTFDTRDSALRPSEGGMVEAAAEYGLGSFTFPILNLEGSRYFTLYKRPDQSGKQVLGLRSSVSWAGENTPVYERFFAGGYTSLRGFQFRGVGPFINGFNVGGDFMLLNSIEYQVPIVASDIVHFVAFVDGGTVESNTSIHDYRVSAGFGFRLAIPQLGPVPIALDFGFPIVRGPGDREQIFSFWIGMFR
jgi:outer membrane protein insertion porin family